MRKQAKEFYERALTKPKQYSKPKSEETEILARGQTDSPKKEFYVKKIESLT